MSAKIGIKEYPSDVEDTPQGGLGRRRGESVMAGGGVWNGEGGWEGVILIDTGGGKTSDWKMVYKLTQKAKEGTGPSGGSPTGRSSQPIHLT